MRFCRTVVLIITLITSSLMAAFAQTSYTITGIALDGVKSYALGINDKGQVVGNYWTETNGWPRPFVWSVEKGFQALPYNTVPFRSDGEHAGAEANAINKSGQIAGTFYEAGSGWYLYGVGRWEANLSAQYMQPVGYLSCGVSIDGAGNVGGQQIDQWMGDWSGGVWNGKDYIVSAAGSVGCNVDALNDAGMAAGTWRNWGESQSHAFRKSPNAGKVDLLFGSYSSSYAYGINSTGDVVGSVAGDIYHMAYWPMGGQLQVLGPGTAYGINDGKTVVGNDGAGHACAWWTAGEGVVDLNKRLTNGAGWTLAEARAINKLGQIVGTGIYNGVDRAFLLTPVDQKVESFAVDPTVVDMPGPPVTAKVITSGVFNKVVVSCDPKYLAGLPAWSISLSGHGNQWTASFPTTFLKKAVINPLPLIATATQLGGKTCTAMTMLSFKTNVSPVLALTMSSDKTSVAHNETVSFTGLVVDSSQAPAYPATLNISLDSRLEFIFGSGVSYDTASHALKWSGELPSGATGLHRFTFMARVKTNAPADTALTVTATISAPFFDSVTVSSSVKLTSQTVPIGIEVVDTGGFGLLFGDCTLQPEKGTPPLHASLSIHTQTSRFLGGNTRLHLWLSVQTSLAGGAKAEKQDMLADFGLMSPSVSPTYEVSFPQTGSSMKVSVLFDEKAALLNVVEALMAFIGEGSDSPFTFSLDDVMVIANDIKDFDAIHKAVHEFIPIPTNPFTLDIAVLRSAFDLGSMSSAEKDAILIAVYAASKHKINIEDLDKGLKFLQSAAGIKTWLETISDLVVLNIRAKGQAMETRFIASPLGGISH